MSPGEQAGGDPPPPQRAPGEQGQGSLAAHEILDAAIAEQRLGEPEAAESDERYRIIVETATEGICTIDTHNTITFVNRALTEMLGYGREEMLGTSAFDFIDPAVLEAAKRSIGRREEGVAERLEYPLRAKDGHEVWALMASSPLYDKEGNYAGALSMVTDITARKAAEAECRSAQETILKQALYDGLTGLPNRALFLDRIANALERNGRDHHSLAVFFIDLDQFRLINDGLGHEAGDQLLRLIAPRLASAIRPGTPSPGSAAINSRRCASSFPRR